MIGRNRSTVAVGAVLLLVVAMMVVLVPGGATAAPDTASGTALDGDESAGGDGVALAEHKTHAPTSEQYERYEVLSTYVPTSTGIGVTSRSDHESEGDTQQRFHRWRCPICDATKISLGAPTGDPDGEAANNLRSHVRNSVGGGHGPAGALPADITNELVGDHVEVLELAG